MKQYKSKVGAFLYVLIFLFILLFCFELYIELFYNHKVELITLLPISFVLSLFIYFLFSTYYMLDNQYLYVKCGFLINLKIDVLTIKEISETKSLISSPALSIDRIEIKYGQHNFVIISPKDKEGFIKDIKETNPKIIVYLPSMTNF